jgi:imidazolonepropionase-like amidohydrolase
VREVFALVGVHVVPMTSDTVLRDMTVLVRDGRIAAIERGTARLPRNVRRISGDGKFLIPGLTDMHTHQ